MKKAGIYYVGTCQTEGCEEQHTPKSLDTKIANCLKCGQPMQVEERGGTPKPKKHQSGKRSI